MSSVRAYRQIAAQAAQRHNINAAIFLRQMSQEAGFRDATSPAGAQGPAQIMPATARSWGVRNVHDPRQAYNAAAAHMAAYLHQYGGSWAKALAAYNAGPGVVGGALPAETRNYIRTILGGRSDVRNKPAGGGGASALGGGQFPTSYTQTTTTTPGVDNTAARLATLQAFLGAGGVRNSSALLNFASVYPTLKDVAPKISTQLSGFKYGAGSPAGGGPAGGTPNGRVSIAPTADRPGTSINPGVVKFVRRIAGLYGNRLTIGTGTNHSRLTINGTVSDHYSGNAADIPLTGRALIKAGQDALIAAGMPASRARKITGGGFNVGKWQVIFNTNAPGWGNHLTHLHVGFSQNR